MRNLITILFFLGATSPAFAQYYPSGDNGQQAAIQHDREMQQQIQMDNMRHQQQEQMAEQQRQIDMQRQQIDRSRDNPFGFGGGH